MIYKLEITSEKYNKYNKTEFHLIKTKIFCKTN